ncbi:MAG TPA: triose-phosphate isomerase [Solirubrobacteraceae bacterium]|nr:triose-phosphate isomerase [Solirubrobacteraceae bacterium]
MSRGTLIAGNWKMHKTVAEAEQLVQGLLPRVASLAVEIAICPPYTALAPIVDSSRGSRVAVFAQNMHEAAQGAFTGEVSASMLVDLGVSGVIVGHSERRALFGETDARLSQKLPAALAAGLVPILCVGETEEQRLAGETESHLRAQLEADLADVDPARYGEVVVAYEPIWAIGTGRVATPEQAQEAVSFIRQVLAETSAAGAAEARLLYGGSVTPDSAAELLALEDVDGALVGGASLTADSFAAICAAAPQ